MYHYFQLFFLFHFHFHFPNHRQFFDLQLILQKAGFLKSIKFSEKLIVNESRFEKKGIVFLGDYVDRGKQSLEVISLLFALKCSFPEKVIILRGNHETRKISQSYGFFMECKQKYQNNKKKKSLLDSSLKGIGRQLCIYVLIYWFLWRILLLTSECGHNLHSFLIVLKDFNFNMPWNCI